MQADPSLRAAVEQPVFLEPYDFSWPRLFGQERDRLLGLLPGAFSDIQHIGSTAVPGLQAKPIIDIMASPAVSNSADALFSEPSHYGYIDSFAIGSRVTDHRWFMRWQDGYRTHHLHVIASDSKLWQHRLRLRDALRSDAKLATAYAELKQRLVVVHGRNREAYTRGKAEFIQRIVGDA